MDTPRVSVVIPCFNATRFVATTLRTVLHQSLRDIEIVIVDDGSTDELGEVLAPFLSRDPRIRLVRQENRGLAAARNRGVAEARASLVAPIDSDDVWHPDFLSECVRALDADENAPFAYAYVFRIDQHDHLLPTVAHKEPPRHDAVGLITLNSVSCGSAAVFRRERLLSAGGYDEGMTDHNLQGAEDWKLIVLLASKASPVLIPKTLVGYRLSPQSMSQSDPARQLKAVRQALSDLRGALPNISDRVFADGETMMIAWLLPTFAARRDYRIFAREFATAYLRNPRWWLNPLVRRIHIGRLQLLLGQLVKRTGRAGPELAEFKIDGTKPFSYLRHEPVSAWPTIPGRVQSIEEIRTASHS